MQSPKSKKRPWDRENTYKKPRQKRKHLNRDFYNSKAWRELRKNFISKWQEKVWEAAREGKWQDLIITPPRQSHILSLPYPVCYRCLKLYILGAYTEIEKGKELDHIDPINPANALDSEGFGDPFDPNNLQLLCPRHHAKKGNRDKRILKLKE